MQRKKIIALILIGLVAIMVIDFRINDEDVIADYFMQFETESIKNISNMPNVALNDERRSPEAVRKSSFSYNAADLENFILDNPVGSVDIQGHDKDTIEVTYEVKVYSSSKEAAEEFLEKIGILYGEPNGTFELEVQAPRPKPTNIRAFEVDFDILAPKDLYIELANKYGNVKVQNFINGLDLEAKYNSTIVNFVKGDIEINNEYGSLNASDLDGKIYIDTSYNQNDFRNIQGSLRIDTAYTDNRLEDVYADTEVSGRYGGGRFENLKGDLDLDIRYMGLDLIDIEGAITGSMEYGEISIESLSNDLDVTSRYADLKVWMVEDLRDLNVDVRTRYGNLRSDLSLSKTKEDSTEMINGQIGSGTTDLKIDARHADVELIYEN